MEAINLAAAILPLLKGPTAQFKEVICYLGKFKSFVREFGRSQVRISTQEVLYKCQIRTILQSALSSAEAEDMLDDPEHAGWQDVDNENTIRKYLTEQGKIACTYTIQSIVSKLHEIELVGEDLSGIIKSGDKPDTKGSIQKTMEKWWTRASKSSQACSLAEWISVGIRDLEEEVTYLTQMVTEAEKCQKSSIRGPITSQEEKTWHQESRGFSVAQNTSRALFKALTNSCQNHQHSLHLTLNPKVDRSGLGRANYEIALQHEGCGSRDSHHWLLICSSSTLEDEVKPDARMKSSNEKSNIALLTVASNSRKRNAPQEEPIGPRAVVREAKADQPALFSMSPPLERPLRNLSREAFFCRYVALVDREKLESCGSTTLGFFSNDKSYTHLVYLIEPKGASHLKRPLGLQNVLSHSRMTIPERIKLARQLMQAPLSFATNSWLMDGWWAFKDICFFVDPAIARSSSLDEPFITAKIGGPSAKIDAESAIAGRSVANPLLFNTAKILIEIAIGEPLRSKRTASDSRCCSNEFATDLKTATRLTQGLGSKLGRVYRKAVEYCLWKSQEIVDFDDQEVQKEFFLSVVQPLRKFEDMWDH